jgi:hypothetical protein
MSLITRNNIIYYYIKYFYFLILHSDHRENEVEKSTLYKGVKY